MERGGGREEVQGCEEDTEGGGRGASVGGLSPLEILSRQPVGNGLRTGPTGSRFRATENVSAF